MSDQNMLPDNVATVFDDYPTALRKRLLAVRSLILQVAKEQETGRISETLKWGQPSYLTTGPKCGTTIRIDGAKNDDTRWALYVHCQTDLIGRFRHHYPDLFEFEGNRALLAPVKGKLPRKELAHCIAMALTYHRNKRAD